ncbi:MAG: TIGR00159 family protein [Bacteroidetes bacterium]|nr:TIGR00159 family protein [Bacteroidota bacterium]MBK9670781.1 TIGR00159 family protein [Bacteroidota bacterium]MBK9801118.1 TIGR00159 family protein [Bacteroidota bacterium]
MILAALPDFFNFRWLDVLDIFLVALLLYQVYKLVRGTVAVNIFIGILAIYFFWFVVKALHMQLLGTLLGQFIGVGVIALIIVFQQEIRKFLLLIGTSNLFSKTKFSSSLLNFGTDTKKKFAGELNSIAKACRSMSESKTGAIIVIETNSDLSFYAKTGDMIQAKISVRLLESIFFKNSPLHDGAIIISGNLIQAARCVLPVSENTSFPANLGMRHRAAAGITEVTSSLAIVVSEQTGEIAISRDGNLSLNISPDRLIQEIEKAMENN